mgnify:CR=1 FL=1
MLPFIGMSQSVTDTVTIHTSAQCGTCKKKIEHDLVFVKGVKSAVLDLDTKNVKVVYVSSKTSPQKIREAISRSGYDADVVLADPKQYKELQECCKKGGHD